MSRTSAALVSMTLLFACSSSSKDSSHQPNSGAGGAGGDAGVPDGGGSGGSPDASGGSGDGAGGAHPCVDTSSDPENCGACGTVCGLVSLAAGLFPRELTIDDTSAYWVNEGANVGEATIMKVSLDGGTPKTIASAHVPSAIAVDETKLYWSESMDGTILRVDKNGGSPETVASGLANPNGLVLDAARVFFSTYSTSGCPDDGGVCHPDGTILSVPKDGGTPTVLATGQTSPGDLAVDDTSVYWTDIGTNIFQGTIAKVSKAGGTPVTLSTGQSGLQRGIAVDAASVYWTRDGVGGGGNGTVMKIPVSGGTPTTLASGVYNTDAIAVDGRNVYFAKFDTAGGSLVQVPLEGGPLTPLASRVSPNSIAVDATNVYFTRTAPDYVDHGAVMKLGAKTCVNGQCACPDSQSLCFGACIDSTSSCR